VYHIDQNIRFGPPVNDDDAQTMGQQLH